MVEQQVAQVLAERRAPGLARDQQLVTASPDARLEQFEAAGLARALDALDSDETAPAHCFS